MRTQVSGLSLTLPRIKVGALPHFHMNGTFNAETGSVPTVSVSWYKKGGLFGSEAIIGVGDNKRYSEAVLPLSPKVLAGIGEGIAGEMGGGGRIVQNFNTKVVRSDADLYSAATIINRSALRLAGA